MIKFARNHLNLPRIVIEMRLFAGYFEMPGPAKIAGDALLFHDALDGVDALERDGVHTARELAAIHRDEFVDAELQSGEHHATVARTRAPADGFRFQHDDPGAAFGQ